MVKAYLCKNTKSNQAWWRMPVIPATWKAEAGESLEPEGRGCSEPRLCHALQPGQQEQKLHLRKKQKILVLIAGHFNLPSRHMNLQNS